jgi:hypothetical protein
MYEYIMNRDSAVSIVTVYGLDGQEVGVWMYGLQTGSGAYPASYPMGTGGFFPRGKAAGVWNWPLASN